MLQIPPSSSRATSLIKEAMVTVLADSQRALLQDAQAQVRQAALPPGTQNSK